MTAQKLPILKQGVKTINAEFIGTGALSQLSFVQSRPYATSFPFFLLSLTLASQSKKTLETSLDLTPPFKTLVDVKVEEMWIIWKIDAVILFKRYMAEKDFCRAHTSRSLDCNLYGLFKPLMTPKSKKKNN